MTKTELQFVSSHIDRMALVKILRSLLEFAGWYNFRASKNKVDVKAYYHY